MIETTSLYIHIPFCQSRCHYCSFAIVTGKDKFIDDYARALAVEAGRYRGLKVGSIYVGGGTPSHLPVSKIETLFKIIGDSFDMAAASEVTFEANPVSCDAKKAEVLLRCGVNRLSLGVQSLNEKYLKYLGRLHRADDASASYRTLRMAGFRNISVDLMYCLPGQTSDELCRDLEDMARLESDHISLYALNVEKGSRFHKRRVPEKAEENQIEEFFLVRDTLARFGFQQYEVSNFAKPGKESSHNINYWRGGNYIGLGLGAHSHENGKRFWNTPDLDEYLAKTLSGEQAVAGSETLDGVKRLKEAFLFGLRMNEGVDLESLEQTYAGTFSPAEGDILEELTREGYITREGTRFKTTAKGQLILDEIAGRLI